MRLSTDGQHILSGVQGVILDGQIVMQNAGLSVGGADFLTNRIVWYGGWNAAQLAQRLAVLSAAKDLPGVSAAIAHAEAHLEAVRANSSAGTFSTTEAINGPGLYAAEIGVLTPVYIGAANWQSVTGLWSDGTSRMLTNHTDGARDSDGNFWPDRQALGSSRQGDWIFVRMPDFTGLIVRSASGVEQTYEFGRYFTVAGMDHGLLSYSLAGGPVALLGVNAVAPPITVPNATPIVVAPDATIWGAGYVSGWSHCLWRDDKTPQGWLLDAGADNFNAAVAMRADGQLVSATGVNQGEVGQNVYLVRLSDMTATKNNGPRWPLTPIDLMTPLDVTKFTHDIAVGVVFPSR